MLKKRDFLSLVEYKKEEIYGLLSMALEFKRGSRSEEDSRLLAGKNIAMIFSKPSTRTRISFEAAINQLGGHAICLTANELQLGRGETIEDTGKVLARYVQAIVVRTFAHKDIEDLAAAADVPVINALTDDYHPCQALADLMTILEKKEKLAGTRLAYIGDGNNVCHSLLIGASKMGIDFVAACPPGYEPDEDIVKRVRLESGESSEIKIINDPFEAASEADIIYTDVWTSMGQEDEAGTRRQEFANFQINADLVSKAKADVLVMHCLPAHRGEEISSEILDGKRSIVFDQAENRLHAQKALLASIVGRR